MESVGPYRLESELGRGAMGVVFRAFDPAIGRQVAVKMIQASEFATDEERAELKLRFAREAAAAGKLSHPNIVTIYQLGEHNGMQFLVCEFVDGQSLERVMAPVGKATDPAAALAMLAQVAGALDYAHAQGVVHRDIKPANILVRADGGVKLTDFGIARIAAQTVTKTGFTMGTLPYMAPEQIRAEKVTGKADQFSLAVVAYRMLGGQMPFTGEHDAALMYKILSEAPPALDAVNPLLTRGASAVILRGLAKTSEARFGSCTELISALAKACAAEAPRPSPAPAPVRPIVRASETASAPERAVEALPQKRRSAIPYGVGAVVVLVGAIYAVWSQMGKPVNPDAPVLENHVVFRPTATCDLNCEANAVLGRVAALPGVASAAIVAEPGLSARKATEGAVAPVLGNADVGVVIITPDYFSTLRLSLIAGRSFGASDDAARAPVGVIDDVTGKRDFPGTTPVGSTYRLAGGGIAVVGMVQRFVGDKLYVPFAQHPQESGDLLTRISGTDKKAMQPAILREVQSIGQTIEPDPSIR